MICTELRSKRIRTASFLVALSLLVPALPALAEPVGKVLALSGTAQAQAAEGGLRLLATNAAIERGDTLITGADGNLQVRFVDDALLMLRPNSRIRIDDYRAEDSTLHSVMSLIAGGLRTLTGRIGKLRRDTYVLHTPTATIGVRGTDYELRLCQGDCPAGNADGLYLGVIDGGIVAHNEAGAFDLKAHEYGLIRNKQAALERLDRLPAALTGALRDVGGKAPSVELRDAYRVGEDLDLNGINSSLLRGSVCGLPGCNPKFPLACIPYPSCP